AQQDERGHPPVALLLETTQLLPGEMPGSQYRFAFLWRAAQLGFVDTRDPPARDESRKLRGRIGARQHRDDDTAGHLLQPLDECGPLVGTRARLVKVVEHDDTGMRQR